MSRKDQVESRKIWAAIEAIENMMFNAGRASERSTSNSMLLRFLQSAKDRAESLELDDKRHTDEERKRVYAEAAAVAHLVAQETALNASEREQYGAFLLSEFFTKSDFNDLEQFYSSAWDRLTEEGKAQMSHRIWEGIRRDEFEFIDLPDGVKEKEAQRLYEALKHAANRAPEQSGIPAVDTQDFMKAWREGRKEEAFEVLSRPSFAGNVSVTKNANNAQDGTERDTAQRKDFIDSPKQSDGVKETDKSVTPESDAAVSVNVLAKLGSATKPLDLPPRQDAPTGRKPG